MNLNCTVCTNISVKVNFSIIGVYKLIGETLKNDSIKETKIKCQIKKKNYGRSMEILEDWGQLEQLSSFRRLGFWRKASSYLDREGEREKWLLKVMWVVMNGKKSPHYGWSRDTSRWVVYWAPQFTKYFASFAPLLRFKRRRGQISPSPFEE